MELIDEIASGGFGRVERVRLPDGSLAARKTFSPQPALTVSANIDRLKERFVREARVQSSLPDDMFIPITELDLASDPPWFLMPLADGNLGDAIAGGTLTQDRALEAISEILDALEHLHRSGIIHRDLKPSNILLHNGRWKLSDFGLVLLPTPESQRLTTSHSAWGTLAYCAPEQVSAFKAAGNGVDIYALGCILHDIFVRSARIPYQRHTCPGPLGPVIERCTETDPARRFQTVADLRMALFAVLSTPTLEGSKPEAKAIALKLVEPDKMTPADMEELRLLLRDDDVIDTGAPVFVALDPDRLAKLRDSNEEVWTLVASRLCEWAHGSFNFEFCDVLVGKLEAVFDLGNPDQKAAAVLAAADLGVSHNRFYVMSRVQDLCGRSLDDLVARRIAVEIVAEDAFTAFLRCAIHGGRDHNVYHPVIAALLDDYLKRSAIHAPRGDFDPEDIPF